MPLFFRAKVHIYFQTGEKPTILYLQMNFRHIEIVLTFVNVLEIRKMKHFLPLFIICLFSVNRIAFAISDIREDSTCASRHVAIDSLRILPAKPVTAASEVFGLNMTVWGFNRFIMNEPFARIDMQSVRTNLGRLPVWDTDKFSTNLIAHPYHGSLYFNSARANGMNFWQSVPFTLAGSLMWEYFMENELPSVNDLFCTTFGGIELGEITFRLSDLILDSRLTGFSRVMHEVVGGLASPMRAFNRLISGEAWRISPYKGNVYPSPKIDFMPYAGIRFLSEEKRSRAGEFSMNVGFLLSYGDLFEDDYYLPYEYFRFHTSFDLFSHQPVLTQVNAIAALWGKNAWQSGERSLSIGVFQHFDYYNSQINSKEGEPISPYRIAQAAALGGGLIYQKKAEEGHFFDVRQELYLNGIALGASLTDYFFAGERDYNLGSGYSIKTYSGLMFKQSIELMISMEKYHIYTWKGYTPNMKLSQMKMNNSNVQGDIGNARLGVFSMKLSFYMLQKWNIGLSNNYYYRRTHYRYHDNVEYATSDALLTVGYIF